LEYVPGRVPGSTLVKKEKLKKKLKPNKKLEAKNVILNKKKR